MLGEDSPVRKRQSGLILLPQTSGTSAIQQHQSQLTAVLGFKGEGPEITLQSSLGLPQRSKLFIPFAVGDTDWGRPRQLSKVTLGDGRVLEVSAYSL